MAQLRQAAGSGSGRTARCHRGGDRCATASALPPAASPACRARSSTPECARWPRPSPACRDRRCRSACRPSTSPPARRRCWPRSSSASAPRASPGRPANRSLDRRRSRARPGSRDPSRSCTRQAASTACYPDRRQPASTPHDAEHTPVASADTRSRDSTCDFPARRILRTVAWSAGPFERSTRASTALIAAGHRSVRHRRRWRGCAAVRRACCGVVAGNTAADGFARHALLAGAQLQHLAHRRSTAAAPGTEPLEPPAARGECPPDDPRVDGDVIYELSGLGHVTRHSADQRARDRASATCSTRSRSTPSICTSATARRRDNCQIERLPAEDLPRRADR